MKIIQQTVKTNVSHLVFDIKNIERGFRVPFDIFVKKDEQYAIIIEAGTLISDKMHDLLSQQKTLYILKADDKKKRLTCKNLEEYILFNRDSNERILRFLYDVNFAQFSFFLNDSSNKLQKECVDLLIYNIVNLIKNNKSFLKDAIQNFTNEYRLDFHSLHVAIYAVHLGSFLKMSHQELLELGTAGLLHDTGIKNISEGILHKNLELDMDELTQVQKHPKYSLEIVEHNYIHNPYVLDAIIHHHERYDGSGYPNKLRAHQIKKHASILGICDVFDALTNHRPHREKLSYFEALKFMIKDPSMQNKFNSEYLQVFLKSLI
jgi:HD-GYP domain-containing protein (c-di-GMP phosphodiesterase class II)